MILTAHDARKVVRDDHEHFKCVEKRIISVSGWSTNYIGVYKHTISDNLYKIDWSEGSTEYQDEIPFQYNETVEFTKVFPVQVTVTKYIPVEFLNKEPIESIPYLP